MSAFTISVVIIISDSFYDFPSKLPEIPLLGYFPKRKIGEQGKKET